MTDTEQQITNLHAFRAIARTWVEFRLRGNPTAARRALARFVARLGRPFSEPERKAFFRASQAVLAEHRLRLRQKVEKLDLLTNEMGRASSKFSDASSTFHAAPTRVVSVFAERQTATAFFEKAGHAIEPSRQLGDRSTEIELPLAFCA